MWLRIGGVGVVESSDRNDGQRFLSVINEIRTIAKIRRVGFRWGHVRVFLLRYNIVQLEVLLCSIVDVLRVS